MKKIFLTAFLILPLIHPASGQVRQEDSRSPGNTIAFGSCSRQNIANQRWYEVLQHHPAVWIWLGDNIYGDTHDMQVMKQKYEQQKAYAGYQELLNSPAEIIGTWDDHDYGVNDGGKNYSRRDESKKLALEFLEVAEDNPVWDREGLYQAYQYHFNDFSLKVILLDTRYFRDTIYRDPETRAYLPNESGDVLGEAQWSWLENEIKNSKAELNIIGSSIQVIPEEHAYEKWANFPAARKRFFNLLEKYPDKKAVLISGDRHIAEISKIDLPGLSYPLYDFTSSGLTHSWREAAVEPNRHRVSDFIVGLNFGLILIEKKGHGKLNVRFEIRGENDVLLDELTTEL
jgi:alkaline phosphatase D